MPFNIRMGVPEMEAYWNDLISRKNSGHLGRGDEKLLKKLGEALELPCTESSPQQPGFTRN